MVTVKYNAQDDHISLSRMPIVDDLIERNFRNCLNWESLRSLLSKRRNKGMILSESYSITYTV